MDSRESGRRPKSDICQAPLGGFERLISDHCGVVSALEKTVTVVRFLMKKAV